MKYKLRFASVLVLTAALAMSVTGCHTAAVVTTNADGTSSTNNQTTFLGTVVTPAGIYAQFRGGNSLAALNALRADPAALPYLNALHQLLESTVTTGNYDPVALSAAVAALPLKSIHDPHALEAIQTGFALWQMFEPVIQQQINGKNPFIVPALQGIADGIGDALATWGQTNGGTPAPAPVLPVPTPPPAKTTFIHISPELSERLAHFGATGSCARIESLASR
jgi:hypothetical protein